MKSGSGSANNRDNFCDLTRLGIVTKPFPHVIQNQFINPEYYEQLRKSFPVCPPSTGPTGFSLYWGDADYQKLLDEQPAWRSLFNTFHSQRFIDWGKEQSRPPGNKPAAQSISQMLAMYRTGKIVSTKSVQLCGALIMTRMSCGFAWTSTRDELATRGL